MSVVTATYTFVGKGEDFGPRSDGMVTLHTTESPYNKLTVADAITLAKWQDRDDILGSYGRLICIDGVLRTVPDDHASGGINPSSTYFKPRSWLYDFMPREEVLNPNYFTLNLAAMGRKDYFDANGWPPEIIDGFARSIIEEEKRIGRGVVVTNHSDFQTNRSDAGQICIDLVLKRYGQLIANPEEDMTWVNAVRWYKTPQLVTFRAGTSYRLTPTLDDTGIYVAPADERRTVIGEVDGLDFGAGPLWLVIPGDNGVAKVAHSQDARDGIALGDTTALQTALDSANTRTAKVKTESAVAMRKAAQANRDLATSEEAAANYIEKL